MERIKEIDREYFESLLENDDIKANCELFKHFNTFENKYKKLVRKSFVGPVKMMIKDINIDIMNITISLVLNNVIYKYKSYINTGFDKEGFGCFLEDRKNVYNNTIKTHKCLKLIKKLMMKSNDINVLEDVMLAIYSFQKIVERNNNYFDNKGKETVLNYKGINVMMPSEVAKEEIEKDNQLCKEYIAYFQKQLKKN